MAGKRKRGKGTVRLRKDGRWEGRVVVGYYDEVRAELRGEESPALQM